MCHFITLVAATQDSQKLDLAMRSHGRRADPIDNPSLAKILAVGERQFLTAVGRCDCGTVLGRSQGVSADELDDQHEKMVHQLRKRGWSDAKIERWLDDVEKAKNRPGGSVDSIELWTEVLSDLLGPQGLRVAGLFVHMYSGAIDSESFDARRRLAPRGADLRESLLSLKEDELLMVQAA